VLLLVMGRCILSDVDVFCSLMFVIFDCLFFMSGTKIIFSTKSYTIPIFYGIKNT